MTKKTFDCIDMKRQIVSEAQQHVVGMSDTEKIAYYKAIGDRERTEQESARQRFAQEQEIKKKSA